MTAVVVQVLLSGSQGSAGSSLVLSGSKTVTAGNQIYVFFVSDKNITATVTDNLSNTYSLLADGDGSVGAPSVKPGVYRATNITGGTLTTITLSHGATFARVAVALEFFGANGPSLGSNTGVAFNATNPSVAAVSGSGLHFFVTGLIYGSSGDPGSFTPPSGYSLLSEIDQGNSNGNRRVEVCSLIGSTSGTKTGTYSGAGSGNWAQNTLTVLVDAPDDLGIIETAHLGRGAGW